MIREIAKKNNKGITLLELIVVVAIIAIASTGVIIGVGIIASGNAEKASKIIRQELLETRTDTMSIKAEWELHIINNGDKIRVSVYRDGEEYDYEEIGRRVKVSYDNMEGNTSEVEQGYELIITFKESSGIVDRILYGAVGHAVNNIKGSMGSYFKITANASSNDYGIYLWYETGKVTYEE